MSIEQLDAPLSEDEYQRVLERLTTYVEKECPNPELPYVTDGERTWSVADQLEEVRLKTARGLDDAIGWAFVFSIRKLPSQ